MQIDGLSLLIGVFLGLIPLAIVYLERWWSRKARKVAAMGMADQLRREREEMKELAQRQEELLRQELSIEFERRSISEPEDRQRHPAAPEPSELVDERLKEAEETLRMEQGVRRLQNAYGLTEDMARGVIDGRISMENLPPMEERIDQQIEEAVSGGALNAQETR